MKQWIALGTAALLVLFLCACTQSGANQVGQTVHGWAEDAKPPEGPRPINVQAYESAEFGASLGIEIVSLPDESQMKANKFFVPEDWYGQIEFTTASDLSLNVRLARQGGKRLSSTYDESHTSDKTTMEIDGLEVTVASAQEGCALVSWQRGDVQYVMHSNTKQSMPPAAEIELMVTGLDASVTMGA